MKNKILTGIIILSVFLSGCTLLKEKTIIQGTLEIDLKTQNGVINEVMLNDFKCNSDEIKACEYIGKQVKVTGYAYEPECIENMQCWNGKLMDVESIEITE